MLKDCFLQFQTSHPLYLTKSAQESQVKPGLIATGLLKVLVGPCLQLTIQEAFCRPADSL